MSQMDLGLDVGTAGQNISLYETGQRVMKVDRLFQIADNELSFEEWMELDVKYMQERRFFVDWKIVFMMIRIKGIENQKYNEIRKIENLHKGKRCFTVATGPSLRIEDVEKLNGEITFGMNSLV